MLIKSNLYKFIQENKNENIKDLLKKEYGLQIIDYPNDKLYIVKYNKKYSNMDNELVRECRSIILDYDNNIISYSPPKSIKLEEFETYIENWKKQVIVQPFLDGTMINIFFHNDKWYISTRSSLNGNNNFYSKDSFNTLFQQALRYNKVNLDDLDKSLCYSFVLQHPDNRIVVKYYKPSLTLVSIYKIMNNGEKIESISLGKFKHMFKLINILHNFNSLEDVKTYINDLIITKQEDIIQGFVLKIGNLRSKIRHPLYNEIKLLRGNNNDSIKTYLLIVKKRKLEEFLEYYPEYKSEFKTYRNKINNYISNLYKFYHLCFIKKKMNVKNIPKIYQIHCYELHKQYQYKLIPNGYISKTIIKKYWKYLKLMEKYAIIKSFK